MNNRNIDYKKYNLKPYSDIEDYNLTPISKTAQTFAGEMPKSKSGTDMPFLKPNTMGETQQNARELGLGFAEQTANIPEEYANAIGKHLYNKFNFAPNTLVSDIGKTASDLASFFLPGGALKLGIKGLSQIPKITKGTNVLTEAIQASPFIKNLLSVGRTGIETGVMGARKHPEQNFSETGLQAGEGAVLQQLLNLATSRNPIINALGKLGIGAGGGYLGGQMMGYPAYESIPAGIGLAFGGPKLLNEFGTNRTGIAQEFLEPTNALSTNYADMKSRLSSAKRLKTALRPSEATGNIYIGKKEGNIPQTFGGAQEMAQQEALRTKDQQDAIGRLLNNIHSNTPESQAAIRHAYKNANKWNMNESFMDSISNDPIIEQAVHKIENTPALRKDLANIDTHNVMYLDQVKRAMDDMRSSALRRGDKNEARIIGETTNKFVKAIDKSVPQYAEARELAQRSIVRSQIEKSLRKGQNKEINAYQFYRKVISNDEEYKKLYNSLSNVPEAQQILKDMKTSWDTAIPPITPRAAVKLSETSMDKSRASIQGLISLFKDLIGSKRDIERAKFIYSKDWEKEIENIQKIKDQKQKRNEMIKLIAKSLGSYEISK